jgi:HD superfamily phosphodiesterase
LDIADSVDEEVDFPILVAAVLFHDIGVTEGDYSGHEERSVKIARRELPEMAFSQGEVGEVAHCIETTGEDSESETIEAKINSDADKLVKAGFASVFNFFRVQAELDKELKQMVSDLSKYEALAEQGFYTERAGEIAGEGGFEERIEFLERFRNSLKSRPDFTAGEEQLFDDAGD